MADYWIKLYHEIIDDPKMATMPDRLWRRAVEMFLLAGKLDKTKKGILPDTRQLAWCLRVDSDSLQDDLEQLHGYGIIEPIAAGWIVCKFETRQAPAGAAERVRRHRELKQKTEYYGNDDVTNSYTEQINRLTESEADSDSEKTTSSSDWKKLYAMFESEIGVASSTIVTMLEEDLQRYGLINCLDAIKISVAQNKRKWSYVRGILKNQWADGKNKPLQENKMYEGSIILPDGTITEA